jgi:hypothetical protein
MSLAEEAEEYLRGYTDCVNMAADSWRVEYHDQVVTLYLVLSDGREATVCMDKGGTKDLIDALELIYYTSS